MMQWRREQNTLLFSGEIEITSFDKQTFEKLCAELNQEISTVDFAEVGDWYCNAIDFKFSYDKTKIEPANKSNTQSFFSVRNLIKNSAKAGGKRAG